MIKAIMFGLNYANEDGGSAQEGRSSKEQMIIEKLNIKNEKSESNYFLMGGPYPNYCQSNENV